MVEEKTDKNQSNFMQDRYENEHFCPKPCRIEAKSIRKTPGKIANDVVDSKKNDTKSVKVLVQAVKVLGQAVRVIIYRDHEIAYRHRKSASQTLKIIVMAMSAYRGRQGVCRVLKSSCFVFCANNVGALRLF
jgi:hypothetical protein